MPHRGFELTSSWSGVRRSNQIASWPVELVFISGGFYKFPIWKMYEAQVFAEKILYPFSIGQIILRNPSVIGGFFL